MASLLDTNVISQRTKERPDERVMRWLEHLPREDSFVSVITLQEIRFGIEVSQPGRRRDRLELWLTRDVQRAFAGRVLPIDERIANETGVLMARERKEGREPGIADALIAATARVHGLRLATLNVKDFAGFGLDLVEF